MPIRQLSAMGTGIFWPFSTSIFFEWRSKHRLIYQLRAVYHDKRVSELTAPVNMNQAQERLTGRCFFQIEQGKTNLLLK